jgi:trimeric autotransporter adhesin
VEAIVAGSTVAFTVANPGAGFNLVELSPNGNGSEHQITSVAGSCEATTLLTGGDWVTQVAAFKAVPAPAPDFTVSALPATQTVAAGAPATYNVKVTAVNGFNSPVALTCAALSLPAGANCAFSPTPVTPGATAATSVLTLSTTAATPVATSTVTITGTFGTLIHNATVGLTVTAAPDFTIAATALTPASVPAGTSATSTITVAPLHAFNQAVALTCAAPSLPAGATCAFVPPSVIPAGTGTTSVLTISTTAGTPIGTSMVTVTGTFGPLTHTTTVTLTVAVAAVPDFTIAAAALSPATVVAGTPATSKITVAPVNGFTGAVNLTCAVTPAVIRPATCSFNPASVPGGTGTSTLTVSTTAATTASLAPQSRGIFFAMLLPIGGLALLGTGITSRKRKLWSFLFGCMLFSGLISLGACGGSSSSGGGGGHAGTPAGTYTVTVTGTSGTLTHAATATLVVQ